MKIKDLKELANTFEDDAEVKIEIKEKLFKCYAYDDEFQRKIGRPTLVIAPE